MRKKVREDYRKRLILPEVYPLLKMIKEPIYFTTKSGTPVARHYIEW